MRQGSKQETHRRKRQAQNTIGVDLLNQFCIPFIVCALIVSHICDVIFSMNYRLQPTSILLLKIVDLSFLEAAGRASLLFTLISQGEHAMNQRRSIEARNRTACK
jgi:hypothetical protein